VTSPDEASRPHSPNAEEGNGRSRLWLIRHGQTEWAVLGRHTGRTDVPLTDAGRAQAVAISARLAAHDVGPDGRPFALVLTSPRSRASETARLAGFGDTVLVDDDLAEWDYGAFEGLTTPQIRHDHPDWTIWTGPWPDGESVWQVGARADRVLDRARAAGGDVLLFSHGHLLRILAARWLGLEPTFGRLFDLSTGTLSVLGWDRENPVVATWNEACHLADAPR
jgi:broad specificity phosphatase PhoE